MEECNSEISCNGDLPLLSELTVEFSGGAQFLFRNRTKISIGNRVPVGTTVAGNGTFFFCGMYCHSKCEL